MKSIALELENLKNDAAKMQEIVVSLQNVGQSLEYIMSDMGGIWEGSAREQFRQGCGRLINTMKELAQEISQRKVELEQSAAVYEKTEMQVHTKVSDLSTDNIF